MVDSIAGNDPNAGKAPNPITTQPAAVKTTEKSTKTKTGTGDTVELSISAQVKSLKQQGQNVNEIAARLGIDAKTVATYLGKNQ